MKLTNKLKEKVNCIKCRSYTSIPHDNGLTDYCLEKNKFIKNVIKYCKKYKVRE